MTASVIAPPSSTTIPPLMPRVRSAISANTSSTSRRHAPTDGKNRDVAPFLKQLRRMLDEECHDIIRWTPDGRAFEIHDIDRMMECILPKYFKHRKYTSFQRQLNYFNFRKWTKSKAVICTFSNEFFVRDRPELAWRITRKKSLPLNGNNGSNKHSPSTKRTFSLPKPTKPSSATTSTRRPAASVTTKSSSFTPAPRSTTSDQVIISAATMEQHWKQGASSLRLENHVSKDFMNGPMDFQLYFDQSEPLTATNVHEYKIQESVHDHLDALDWTDCVLSLDDECFSIVPPTSFQTTTVDSRSITGSAYHHPHHHAIHGFKQEPTPNYSFTE